MALAGAAVATMPAVTRGASRARTVRRVLDREDMTGAFWGERRAVPGDGGSAPPPHCGSPAVGLRSTCRCLRPAPGRVTGAPSVGGGPGSSLDSTGADSLLVLRACQPRRGVGAAAGRPADPPADRRRQRDPRGAAARGRRGAPEGQARAPAVDG